MSIGGISGGSFSFSNIQSQFAQQRAAQFAEDDADSSGGLSLDEFKAAHEKRAGGAEKPAGAPSVEEIFSSLDADGSGEVTQAEIEAAGPPPPPPGGGFSPEGLTSALSLQEDEDSTSSILDLLTSSATDESSESDDDEASTLAALLLNSIE